MPSFTKPNDLPVDQVRALKARGFDNNQIVLALQRNGYSSTQIFDALNQADLVPATPSVSSQPPPLAPQQPALQQAPSSDDDNADEQIEEMIESVVEEKWGAAQKELAKMNEWKSDVDSRISKLEQRIDSMKDDFDKLHQAIIGKIGDYDKNILAVGAEIKAMEKVFSKVLPMFTENVAELNRITQTLGSSQTKTQSTPVKK